MRLVGEGANRTGIELTPAPNDGLGKPGIAYTICIQAWSERASSRPMRAQLTPKINDDHDDANDQQQQLLRRLRLLLLPLLLLPLRWLLAPPPPGCSALRAAHCQAKPTRQTNDTMTMAMAATTAAATAVACFSIFYSPSNFLSLDIPF